MMTIVLSSVLSAVVCLGIYILVTKYVTKKSIKALREAARKEAEAEGEMIKKEKILQAKEKFIQLKSEHDRQVNERNQKIAQSEQRAKQIENNLQNQQRELEGKVKENARLKEQMEAQLQMLEHKKEEIDRLMHEQNTRLEQISGLSSEDAKSILIENMKAEAKADAVAYINETIEEAKMTATKEAKRIIVASIQRVATETAIENALKERVWLKHGGYLVIQVTEALTVVDVNSGKSIKKSKNTPDALKLNLEAAQETARQIRLRNLSGIILVDFVNMDDPEMEETLFQEFRFYLTKDPIQTTLVDITALGLAEVTRKKVRKPLYEMITV